MCSDDMGDVHAQRLYCDACRKIRASAASMRYHHRIYEEDGERLERKRRDAARRNETWRSKNRDKKNAYMREWNRKRKARDSANAADGVD